MSRWLFKNSIHALLQRTLGVQVGKMKMDLNIYGTWCQVGQWTLMMKMYDFFIWLSRLITPYNNVKKSSQRWKIFYILLYKATKRLSRIFFFSSLVFIARPDTKCHKCLNPFSYFGLWHLLYRLDFFSIQISRWSQIFWWFQIKEFQISKTNYMPINSLLIKRISVIGNIFNLFFLKTKTILIELYWL